MHSLATVAKWVKVAAKGLAIAFCILCVQPVQHSQRLSHIPRGHHSEEMVFCVLRRQSMSVELLYQLVYGEVPALRQWSHTSA